MTTGLPSPKKTQENIKMRRIKSDSSDPRHSTRITRVKEVVRYISFMTTRWEHHVREVVLSTVIRDTKLR
jgi:hypothetical protein